MGQAQSLYGTSSRTADSTCATERPRSDCDNAYLDALHDVGLKRVRRRDMEMQRGVEKLSHNGIEFKARILRGQGLPLRIVAFGLDIVMCSWV